MSLSQNQAEKVLEKLRGNINGLEIMESNEKLTPIAARKQKMKIPKTQCQTSLIGEL